MHIITRKNVRLPTPHEAKTSRRRGNIMKKDHKELPQHVKGYLQKIDDYFEKAPFKGFLQEMDSFFHKHNVFQSIPVDLYETATEVVVQAELPGVHKNQIMVDVQDTFIKIEIAS